MSKHPLNIGPKKLWSRIEIWFYTSSGRRIEGRVIGMRKPETELKPWAQEWMKLNSNAAPAYWRAKFLGVGLK